MTSRSKVLPVAVMAMLGLAGPASSAPFVYSPITEPILSATFNADFAAMVAARTFLGVEVNMVQLQAIGFPMLDLSDAFFGPSDETLPPRINMGALETGVVSAPISTDWLPALASGATGYWLTFTDTGDGLFAMDAIWLEITTASRTIHATLDSDNGFGIGIPNGGNLPAPLPESIPIDATGRGFDETISSKELHSEVPEPPAWIQICVGGLLTAIVRYAVTDRGHLRSSVYALMRQFQNES